MKALALLAALVTLGATAAMAQSAPEDLVGTWSVDLRPSPDAPAYTQPFIVAAVDDDGRIQGTFYGSPILESEINANWDGVWFAVVTADMSSRYVHVGRLIDGALEGSTYSPERDLLQPWRAVRADTED